jgi:hypothetical protein
MAHCHNNERTSRVWACGLVPMAKLNLTDTPKKSVTVRSDLNYFIRVLCHCKANIC